MTIDRSSDVACIEDIAASALRAGRTAAGLLRSLHVGPVAQTTRAVFYTGILSGPRLLQELGLDILDGLERELHQAVEAEAYYVPAFGAEDADEPIRPDRRLSSLGQRIEAARDAVAVAVERARYTLDLVRAEEYVGRARGLVA